MYTRVAAFEDGDSERIPSHKTSSGGNGETGSQGVRRVLLLNDNGSNQRLTITFYDSSEAIDAAADQFEKMDHNIPEDVRGHRTSPNVYEIIYGASI